MAVINNADCNADNGCRRIGKAHINERMAHVNPHEIRKRKPYKERLHHTLNHNKGEDRLPVRTNAGSGSGNGLLRAQRCDLLAREVRAAEQALVETRGGEVNLIPARVGPARKD
jgi:hypothetical protein